MAKQLVIDIKAIDNISPVTRQAVANMLLLGDATIKTEKTGSSALSRLAASAMSLKGLLVGIAASVTAGLGARAAWQGLSSAAAEMDHIGDEALRLKMTTQELSSLKYTADIANVSFQALADGIFNAEKKVGEFVATRGGGRAAVAFRELNVQLVDSRGNIRSMTDLLPEFIDRLNEIGDTQGASKRNYLVSKIFGDGPEFIRLLAEGGDRLRAINQEARAMGVVFTPEQIQVANSFRDSLDRVRQAWFGVRAAAVVAAGPWLTEMLNKVASGIASVPVMARTLFRTIGDAMGEGPEANAARAKFQRWWESLGGVAMAGIKIIGVTVLAGGLVVARTVTDYIFADIAGRAGPWAIKVGARFLNELSTVLPEGLGGKWLRESAVAAGVLANAAQQSETVQSKVKGFSASFASDLAPSVAAAIAMVRAEAVASGHEFAAATDEVLNYTEALAKAQIQPLPNRPERKAEKQDLSPDWLRGANQGLDEFLVKARDTFEYGRAAAGQMAESITDGLTTAIVDSISGVKSLGEAFRQFGAQTLRMISELIVKMLLLKLISGVAGSFAGGGGGTPDEGAFFQNSGGVIGRIGGPGWRRFAAGGIAAAAAMVPAMLTPGEVLLAPGSYSHQRLHAANAGRRMAGGGIVVPGPNIDRDIVPAMLPVGTGVLSRRGVRHYADGGVAGAGYGQGARMGEAPGMVMGGSVAIHIHSDGRAGVSTGRSTVETDRQIADALIRIMNERPAVREMIRGIRS